MALLDTSKLFDRPARNYKVIDGIRAIAILWVILFHVWLFHIATFPEECAQVTSFPLLVWLTKGDLGVDLFFVISGFLIGTILFREYNKRKDIDFKRFYIRRFLRLMPVYIVCMIMGALLSKGTPLENWHMAWANLLYINNYVRDSYMTWTWSLAIEEQFYLIIPFLILYIFPKVKHKLYLFLGLAILPIALKLYYTLYVLDYTWPMQSVFLDDNWNAWFWDYYVPTHFRYGGLLAGVALAYAHTYRKAQLQSFFDHRKIWVTALTSLSILVLIVIPSITLGQWSNVESSIFAGLPRWIANAYEAIHRELFYYAVSFIILACLYSSQAIIRPIQRFLSMDFFFPIAQVSYSAYLFHEMFMYLYFPQAKIWLSNTGMSAWSIMILNGAVSLLVILIVSSLMFLLIEQPFQRLKERF